MQAFHVTFGPDTFGFDDDDDDSPDDVDVFLTAVFSPGFAAGNTYEPIQYAIIKPSMRPAAK
jgi:hypothetical protein